MDGYLLIDKPAGISSFGVVAKVRGIWRQQLRSQGQPLKTAKVGHTGTLDPMASGLMILVLGAYCKRAGEFSKLYKTYEAELTLGAVSTTVDAEGEITPKDSKIPSSEQLKGVLNGFLGEIEQTPPIFSAIKVGGQRAYKLAREGRPVELAPRPATVYEIKNVAYKYPLLRFTARVSSGTYIRSLAQDIGNKLGTGAYLSALRRTQIGSYDLTHAVNLQDMDISSLRANLKQ